MILVITGTGEYPFERLLRKADGIAPAFEEPFLLQTGPVAFSARHCKVIGLVGYDVLMGYYREASLVVAHTSSGPLLYSSRFEKPLITVPRRKDLGEAVADHQLETAAALKAVAEPMRLVLDEVDGLESAIRSMLGLASRGIRRYTTGNLELTALREAIRAACG